MRAAALVALGCLFGGADARAACTVAASWPGGGARWQVDMAAVAAAVKDGGCDYLQRDAEASAGRQLRDLSVLGEGSAKVLIVTAVDPQRVLPAVDSVLADGRTVIAYDRAIPKPDLLYLSFDAVDVGRLQAESLLHLRPKGRYVILKGDAADPNADLVYRGQRQVLDPAIKKGEIALVGDSYVADWSAASASTVLEGILDASPGGIDAILAANDEIAGAAIAVLEKRGLASVAVAGQDGEPAALHRIALGTQAMTVWKDGRRLGAAAGKIATALAKGRRRPTWGRSIPGRTGRARCLCVPSC